MSVSIKDWCVAATFVLLSLANAHAQNGRLAWDQPESNATLGYKVSFDGLTTDYGISPFGALFGGSCGCAVPLPFSGGHHTIVVTAYGPFGQIDSQAFQVGPIAAQNGPYAGVAGTPISVDGSGSTSPNGFVVSYKWQWGDGTADTVSSSATTSHAFAGPGTYAIVLTATDNAGAVASVTGAATISDPGSPAPPPWTPPAAWTPPSPWSRP